MKIPIDVLERRRAAALNGLSVPVEPPLQSNYALEAMSREGVQQFVRTLREPWRIAIISIAGVGTREGHPRFPSGIHVLRTRFNDIVDPGQGNARAVLFTMRQAQRILRFVESLPGDVDTLIAHCHGGASRSRAVVAALRRLRGEDDLQEWIDGDPNPHIYKTLLTVGSSRASRSRKA